MLIIRDRYSVISATTGSKLFIALHVFNSDVQTHPAARFKNS